MPKQKSDEYTVIYKDRVARLHKRPGTDNWCFKVKQASGWKSTTASTPDLAAARERALEHLTELCFREKHGLAPQARTFKAAAESCIKDLETELVRAGKRTSARNYINALRGYHIPYLGAHHIDRIGAPLLRKFDQWRIEELGRTPKKSTLQDHNAALNRVFEHSLRSGWIKQHHIPDLWNDGEEGETRATFSQSELERLVSHLDKWVGAGRKGLSQQIRFVLRDFIIVVAHTGVRPGTETESITWDSLQDHRDPDDGAVYLSVRVSGKTGPRQIIAPDVVRKSLDRLRAWNTNAKKDWPVFAVLDGRYCGQQFVERFRDLLAELGLREDAFGQTRTLYSLRHHYATMQRMKGIPYEVLKNQMGTSIAMLERHYDHVNTLDEAAKLVGTRSMNGALVLDIRALEGRKLTLTADGMLRLAS